MISECFIRFITYNLLSHHRHSNRTQLYIYCRPGKQNKAMDNNEEITSPKSPKTPKLSEEVSEINLSEEEVEVVIEGEIEVVIETEEEERENNEISEVEIEESADKEASDNSEFIEDPVIINVLEQLLSNSPAGQVQKVSSLCTELFPNYREFIEKQSQAKMDRDGYISEGKLVCEAEDVANDNSEDPFKTELTGKLENYMKELFPGTGAFSITKVNENEWKVHIVGERLKPKAFWSGHWHSTWSIRNFEESESSEFKIDGKIDLIVHYHEEGSVQLSASKEIPSRVNFQSESLSQSLEKIYFKIKDTEDAFQLALNEAYQELAEKMFKKLRRQLPVTRTKMDWGKFVNYNLSSELKK